MKLVTLKLTVKELELLTALAADQLFRREFIDPRMPGHKSNPEDMNLSKTLVGRLRKMVDPSWAKRTPPPRTDGATV
jgi:DNA-binding response OmpR family regulator